MLEHLTPWFESALRSGLLIDMVLAFTVLEAVLLTLYLSRRQSTWRRRLRPLDVLPTLAAGLCLMLALRAVLVQAHWLWIAAALAAAFVAHVGDLQRRLRQT